MVSLSLGFIKFNGVLKLEIARIFVLFYFDRIITFYKELRMDNIWFQYKIGKQLDELEIEDSLCLSLFKSLENCIKFKKLSNIGLKEAEVKRDTEISRWHTELLREKNLKEQRRQKEEQEKKSQENFQKFLEFCKQQNRVLKKFDNTNFSFECDEPATKKPLENPTNNILNSNHQNTRPQNNTKMFDYFDNPMFRY